MLTKKQIGEIKEHLSHAQNPLFFFDNDPDGLCSFLLLQRYLGRGKGVPIRSFPGLSVDYFKKIIELKADYIFILDKPVVSKEFFDEVEKVNIPVVWIDHHLIDKSLVPDFVNYYNPLFNRKKSNEPVTYLSYQITGKKEDAWIAVIGCISDNYVPNFYSGLKKDYPDMYLESKNAFDIFYNSGIGKIAKIFNFALKDRTTNVINMIKFLIKVRSPKEVLEETNQNYTVHKRFDEINRKYSKLLVQAKKIGAKSKEILFFQYSGDLSISSELANELTYSFPSKIVVVAYVKGLKANISVRGKNIRELILKSIKDLEDSSGGGHENAVGVQVRTSDLEQFRKNIISLGNFPTTE
jgi:single-stranded DNA-specific DHH superfamily exonuclease